MQHVVLGDGPAVCDKQAAGKAMRDSHRCVEVQKDVCRHWRSGCLGCTEYVVNLCQQHACREECSRNQVDCIVD